MTDERIRQVLAPYTAVEFTIEELEELLVASRTALIAAGATSPDLRRAASYLIDNVTEDWRIGHQARSAMLPVFEKVFGFPMPALRARVAADAAAWHAMKAGGLSDAEIEESLNVGHYGKQPAGDPERPLMWWGGLLTVVFAILVFPLLWSSILDNQLFRYARRQRGLVLFMVALLQAVRVLVGWAVWQVAWTWLAWIVTLTLAWRVWVTANVWWSILENRPAPALERKE